jgi:hypothetical protein
VNIRVETFAVLAGAYKGKPAALLTHACWVDYDDATMPPVPLCHRVSPESMTEAPTKHEAPTCPTCRKRDPRTKTRGPSALAALLTFRR